LKGFPISGRIRKSQCYQRRLSIVLSAICDAIADCQKVAGNSETGKGKARRAQSLAARPTKRYRRNQSLGRVPIIWLQRRGERTSTNLPQEGRVHDKDGLDGYYCHYRRRREKHVESISSFSCGSTYAITDRKYLAWQIAYGPSTLWWLNTN